MNLNRTVSLFHRSVNFMIYQCCCNIHNMVSISPPFAVMPDICKHTVMKNSFMKSQNPIIVESMTCGLDKLSETSHCLKVFTDDSSMVVTYLEGKTQFALVFSTNPANLSTLLNSPDVIDPKCNAIIRSNISIKLLVNYQIVELPRMIRYRHCGLVPLKEKCLPDGFKFDKIHVSNFDLVVSKWNCKTWNGARDLLYHFVTTYPNVGLYDMRLDRPRLVSWVLTSGLGIINHLHTLEEYNRQGLAAAVGRRITNELLSKGIKPQADVSINNAPSHALLKACGYIESCSLFVNLK